MSRSSRDGGGGAPPGPRASGRPSTTPPHAHGPRESPGAGSARCHATFRRGAGDTVIGGRDRQPRIDTAKGACPTGLTANRVGQGPSIPRMRFLILAAALACTASPALGQVRQELRERGKLGNVSAQTRLELMYDLGRDGTAERCGGP